MKEKVQFETYRYQILPINRDMSQGDLYRRIGTLEELITAKNDIFAEVLLGKEVFQDKDHVSRVHNVFNGNDLMIFRVSNYRSVRIETKDFRIKNEDSYPWVYVIVLNKPDEQIIAVQKRTTAFDRTSTVINLMEKAMEAPLFNNNLKVVAKPIFEARDFWALLKRYSGSIQSVDFEIVTPNMANISKSLPEEMKAFAKASNATQSHYKLESASDASLSLAEGNETLDGLVEYSSKGGGNITVKVKNIKGTFKTQKTVKKVKCDEAQITGSPEQIRQLIREIIDD